MRSEAVPVCKGPAWLEKQVNLESFTIALDPEGGFTVSNPRPYTEQCGNPFQGVDGWEVAYRAAFHGKYFIQEGKKVWHEGGPSDSISCATDSAQEAFPSPQRDTHIERCVWWGASPGGNGGVSASYGHHITAVGRFSAEERGGCGNGCGGPNPWHQFPMPPMAYYLWASGNASFHETDCIDCY